MADDQPFGGAATLKHPDSVETPKLRPADPCALVLFGATGDLAKRLVVPALYNLSCSGALPEHFALIGVARGEDDVESWRQTLYDALKGFVADGSGTFSTDHIEEAAWTRLADGMSFVQGDITKPETYQALCTELAEVGAKRGTQGNAIFYLAVADQLFGPVVDQLSQAGLTKQGEADAGKPAYWRRVVIEKPFGHSLDSARALNADIQKALGEDQIFRIDHFLGKDTVQSIMAFRFANGLFEPIWNRDRIDHVQITAAETVGVEKRGDFYERTGALRDMVPNHIFSLLSLVAMEPPTDFEGTSVLSRKADVLAAIPAAKPTDAVRGQYGAGEVKAKPAAAYRDEPDVAADSHVETYAAVQLEIDNWRWAGVPFFIRTGKHLAGRVTEIAIRFKPAPYSVFQDTPVDRLRANWLVMRIAPDESISLQFEVKQRGAAMQLAAVDMAFKYDDWFPKTPNVGYEVLLYDVMIGDPTLFMRADMIEHGWRIVQPVLDAWEAPEPAFPNYASGSAGPQAADDLIAREGHRSWRPITPPAGKAP
ncbi:MAG: glucose-6-phosphate dehydrogenase [Caulobacteraceae bacterium]